MAASAPVAVPMDVPPYCLSSRVYGALLNHRTALATLGDAVNQPPYHGAPLAPVLYIKPRNTLALSGDPVTVPADAPQLEIGACLGMVIGRPACRVTAEQALDHVAGFLIVNDVSVPHRSYYRPAIRSQARDGFCPLGPRVVPRAAIADPDAVTIRIYVDGELQHSASTAQLVRPVAKLLVDVTEFMTLSPGDVLAVGAAAPAPRVHAGQHVSIAIDGLGRLENPFVGAGA
jgi:5-oxopent-3-ene-1,2,5-tricarboxylate decarboxylase / 2-hydroxyhepta-2,4-diene-1,7-dioate isomerase